LLPNSPKFQDDLVKAPTHPIEGVSRSPTRVWHRHLRLHWIMSFFQKNYRCQRVCAVSCLVSVSLSVLHMLTPYSIIVTLLYLVLMLVSYSCRGSLILCFWWFVFHVLELYGTCYADVHLRFWGILVLIQVLQHLLLQLLIWYLLSLSC